MGRGAVAFWLVGLLFLSLLPLSHPELDGGSVLSEEPNVARSGASNLTIAFSNGPTQNDVVKGTKALTFSIGGTGTLASLLIELSSDESSWSSVVNLSSSPWIYPFDTTKVSNDTYKLRASGWDSVCRMLPRVGLGVVVAALLEQHLALRVAKAVSSAPRLETVPLCGARWRLCCLRHLLPSNRN